MKLRPLVIDEELKRQVAAVEVWANDHPYIPGRTAVPGDDPRYCLTTTFGYRCVFSYTQSPRDPGEVWRDLSISVDEKDKYPNEFAAFALAKEFGFTGWNETSITPPPEGWLITKDLVWDAIRICQKVSD